MYRLEVHHIQQPAQGGSDFDRDGLIALCRDWGARVAAARGAMDGSQVA